MLVIFIVMIRDNYASTKNFYKPCTRTNIGKQSVSAIIVVDLWKDLPASLKKKT